MPALGYKVGDNTVAGAISSVGIGSVYFIGTVVAAFAKQLPVKRYTFLQSCTFIEGIVAKVFYKADTIYLQLVYFSAKLYGFGFFTSYNGAYVRFA